MDKIRELFHKIGNLHNKISVGAGVCKAELKRDFKDVTTAQEIEKIIGRLSELEGTAIEASKDLRQLKDMIYSMISMDGSMPK